MSRDLTICDVGHAKRRGDCAEVSAVSLRLALSRFRSRTSFLLFRESDTPKLREKLTSWRLGHVRLNAVWRGDDTAAEVVEVWLLTADSGVVKRSKASFHGPFEAPASNVVVSIIKEAGPPGMDLAFIEYGPHSFAEALMLQLGMKE